MARDIEIRRGGRVLAYGRACGHRDIGYGGHLVDVEPGELRLVATVQEEERNMDEQKHTAVMDALAELIRSQLAGKDRARFACVKRLAVIGQKLMTEMRPGADDAETNVNFENGDDIGDGIGVYGGRRLGQIGGIVGGGGDQQQMVREMLALVGPAMSGLHGQNDARRRESMARELNELLDARVRLMDERTSPLGAGPSAAAVERLTRRIDAILVAMGEDEQKEGDEDGLSVVSAVDVRRHQAGQGERVLDAAHADGAFADGEGRRAGALRQGDEARGAPDGVGIGG